MQATNKLKETIMEKQEEENLLALLKSTDDEDVILALVIILNNNMTDWLLSKCEESSGGQHYLITPYRLHRAEIYWMYRGDFVVGIGHKRLFISNIGRFKVKMREI